MDTLFPSLSITLSQRRWSCILDPTLVLGHPGLHGLTLAKYLGDVVELWVVKELWHILDNTHFYLAPSHGTGTKPSITPPFTPSPPLNPAAIHAWEQVRLKTDLAGLKISWLGDAVSQSSLPPWLKEGVDPEDVIRHYEHLAQTLEPQLTDVELGQPLAIACRDAVALAATLGTGFILTCEPEPGQSPYLVDCLEQWQIPCHRRPLTDPIAAIARQYWHHLLVHAGLPQLLWSQDLHLAVLHLSAPTAVLPQESGWGEDAIAPLDPFDPPWHRASPPAAQNPWQSAQGYWYSLQTLPTSHTPYETPSLSFPQTSAPA